LCNEEKASCRSNAERLERASGEVLGVLCREQSGDVGGGEQEDERAEEEEEVEEREEEREVLSLTLMGGGSGGNVGRNVRGADDGSAGRTREGS